MLKSLEYLISPCTADLEASANQPANTDWLAVLVGANVPLQATAAYVGDVCCIVHEPVVGMSATLQTQVPFGQTLLLLEMGVMGQQQILLAFELLPI